MDEKLMGTQSTALLNDLLSKRRSVRSFSQEKLSLAALESILVAGQGCTSVDGKRSAPSAHALHPLMLTVVIHQVEGLSSGVYAFDSKSGRISRNRDPIKNGLLNAAALGDERWLEEAPAVIVIAADRDLAILHFADQQADGLRGARYVDFEAGAVTQNMYLATTAAGLGGVVVMGFDDIKMKDVLGLKLSHFPVALFCVGHPQEYTSGL
ncbi:MULTISPECIES: SagB/ThcOx family dehydrogenase [unclassified Pseudomonas]|uniref:nitroreductase family protein n=1 Tax=unclassified Pseudomonas TaxID=196821 RepID=UPI002B222CA7|nr:MULTISPECIES: SagB/ThcOx family dehydrogenase [unclassified Pseudomonas]MEA9976861.1 SagB/ThcOx family dehydrogenase [Pseudomonas sp. RTS4]MEB0196797.1 SagB/ThcOx family dehydrogenase [Pseudomonas sp. 5S4]MEB0244256.1 SagB/ThcOx family dehydrogenase [Pseudomonas sp. 10S5]